MNKDFGRIVIYKTPEGDNKIEVKVFENTVWLNQKQLSELFGVSKATISEHIKNIFTDGELLLDSVVRNFRTTATDGKNYNIDFYNLDMILAIGYRVRSNIGVNFRKWATETLKEYMIKGFAINDDILKQAGGGRYFKELLARIRDIRSSERVFWRQVLDIFATSSDYDPRSEISINFFITVQNNLHYAAHGHTAAEVIYERADAEQPFMGLKTFEGELPAIKDIKIAKNYLHENELKILNNLVSGYFDFAEIMAMEHRPVYMMDYVKQLDTILQSTGRPLLKGSGSISHQEAMEKALAEYRKYQVKTLTPVEQAYLESINALGKIAKRKGKQNDSH